MAKISIIEGKFYKDGIEIKPEFGNIEQIQALKAAERKSNELEVEAKLIEKEIIQYYACIEFICPICKTKNSIDIDEDNPSEYCIDNSDVNGYDVTCTNIKCNTEFTIEAVKKSNMGIILKYDPIE